MLIPFFLSCALYFPFLAIDHPLTFPLFFEYPPKNLFILASESFDNGDEKFINYIVNEIGTDIIKESLKEAIKEMYTTVTPVTNI